MRIEKKTWPEYFQLILEGKKTYDMRVADFDCKEGDVLVLREWNSKTEKYTGRVLEKEITYVGKTKTFDFWEKDDLEKHGLQCISLKQDNISQETFEKEISICQKMYKEKAGCNWGKCAECGVVPLLVKLCEGKIIEDQEEIKTIKSEHLRKNK